MKKFPFQFVLDFVSLAVLLFVYWTRHGGLRSHIRGLFDRKATALSFNDQVEHIGDLLFYYAVFAVALVTGVSILKKINHRFLVKLHEKLPTIQELFHLLLQIIQQLIIFVGVYVYLLHNDGFGLTNKHTVLLPFWSVVSVLLYVFGKTLTAISPIKLDFSGPAVYLKIAKFGIMFAQIIGYTPLKHF